jgi:hypothetical protein
LARSLPKFPFVTVSDRGHNMCQAQTLHTGFPQPFCVIVDNYTTYSVSDHATYNPLWCFMAQFLRVLPYTSYKRQVD